MVIGSFVIQSIVAISQHFFNFFDLTLAKNFYVRARSARQGLQRGNAEPPERQAKTRRPVRQNRAAHELASEKPRNLVLVGTAGIGPAAFTMSM